MGIERLKLKKRWKNLGWKLKIEELRVNLILTAEHRMVMASSWLKGIRGKVMGDRG